MALKFKQFSLVDIKIYSWFSIRSWLVLGLDPQMSKVRQVTRQFLIYFNTLSLGIITLYRTFDKNV